jgi:hypothetical protein
MGKYAALGRNGECVLRLISQGMTKSKHFSAADVDALSNLALIEEHRGTLKLTEQGKLRLAQERKRLFQSIVIAARD